MRANSRYDDLTRAIVASATGGRQVNRKLQRLSRGRLGARSPAPPSRPARSRPEREQATNWTAIIIFAAFVLLTLGITYWAAQRTRTAKDFYAAGGGVSGFQNGLAIAGDYMSAASFLGISALVYTERLSMA